MKETLENLWNNYLAEECLTIDTEEERYLTKYVGEMRKKANELLTDNQIEAIDKYVEALYNNQDHFTKKAFFMGCKYAIAFFFEID